MRKLLFLLLFFACTQAFAQTEITWKTLENVRFSRKYFEEIDEYLYYPHFGKAVQKLEGQVVLIEGYMLPLDPEEDIFILSRNPFAACYFCGASGPESIIELMLNPDHPPFEMDQVLMMKGILRLNQDDYNHCNYILEAAEVWTGDTQTQ